MQTAFQTEEDLMDKVFWTDMNKGIQYRFSISKFYDKMYLGIRKWVLVYDPDIDESWIPTKEGMTIPYSLESTTAIWNAFTEILSEAEVLDKISEHELISELKDWKVNPNDLKVDSVELERGVSGNSVNVLLRG